MYTILNEKGDEIAYIQNMMILDIKLEGVVGILIGDCFFGKQKNVIGKIFNNTAYLISGEIVGKIQNNKEYKNINLKKAHMMEAWDLLSNIKEHTSDWIVETKKWSKKSLFDHLT